MKYLCSKEDQHCGTCPACARNNPGSNFTSLEGSIAEQQVGELAMLVKKLSHSLKKTNRDSGLPDRAMDYLQRHNLISGPLR